MSEVPEDLRRLVDDVLAELDAALHPLLRAGRDPRALNRLLHQVGWNLEALVGADPDEVAAAVDAVHRAYLAATAVDLVGGGLSDAAVRVTAGLGQLAGEVELPPGSLFDAVVDEGLLGELVTDVGEHLLLRHLADRAPLVVAVARALAVVVPVQPPELRLPGATTAPPVRVPVLRLGVNRSFAAAAAVLPVRAVIDNLSLDSFRSVDAFLAGLHATFRQLLAPAEPYLDPSPLDAVVVTLTPAGLAVQAPGRFPPIAGLPAGGLPVKLSGIVPDGDQPIQPDELPELVLRHDGVALNWAEATEPVELIPDVLALLPRLAGHVTGVVVELSARPAAAGDPSSQPVGTIRLTTTAAFALTAHGSGNQLVAQVGARLDGEGSFELTATARGVGDVVLPLGFTGLDGLALVVAEPVAEARFTGGDEPELRITVAAAAFAVRLPLALARKAVPAPGGRWQLEVAAPEVRFFLQDPTGVAPSAQPQPLATVSFGQVPGEGGGVGAGITELSLIEPSDGSQVRVEADSFFIGPGGADSGFVIDVDGFSWSFADGGSSLVGGIAVERATVHLPPALEVLDSVEISDATITDRGFTGAVSVLFDGADAAPREDTHRLSGLPFSLHSLHLQFVDNWPTAFEVSMAIRLPYFDEWVDVTVGIDDDFSVRFRMESADPAGITLTKDELLTLNFRSAGFTYEHQAQRLVLSMSGGIEPLLWNADGLEWPRLDVTNLELEQDLSSLTFETFEPPVLRFEEAWLDLKDLATLDLFGFHFELDRIGIGYVEATDQLWLDLSGSLRLIEFVPIGLGVEGFRITWPRRIYEELGIGTADAAELTFEDLVAIAGRIEVQFDGVYLFFGIPEAIEFEGYIRFIKEAQKVGFAGDMALRVPATGLAIEAGLLVGMNFAEPPYPYLYVYFGVLLPTGIPLGQSGLALKGAKGLFGINVYPDRTPEQNPYYDWYQRGPIQGAHPTNKWRDQIWSIAFGAGITITTTDGKLLGVQGLLALVIPGPIVFVEGKALVFDGIFPGDGPLKALGYFDGNELTAHLNVEAGLELVEGVIDVNAGVEAFFDFTNLWNWHIYLGQDEPVERRIRANVLKLPLVGWLFQANAYLMIDMASAETVRARLGAYIGFEPPPVELVVASAAVRAVIDGEGLLTVNPTQFHGGLALDALLDVDAFGLTVVGAQAAAEVTVEGALPLSVEAVVAARVDLPVPEFEDVPLAGEFLDSMVDWFEENVAELPDVPEHLDVEVPFEWRFDGPPVIDPIVRGVALESRAAIGGVQAVAQADAVERPWDLPVVPLDARPTVQFDQHVNQADGLSFGGFATAGMQRFASGGLVFTPTLRDVVVSAVPAHLFDPADLGAPTTPWEVVGQASSSTAATHLWGGFRPEGAGGPDGGGAVPASRRTLDLWTANVFEFLTGVVPLALAADDATARRPPVSPGAGLLQALRWCDDSAAAMTCVGKEHLDELLARPTPVVERFGHGEGTSDRLTVDGIELVSRNLRAVGPSEVSAGEPFVLAAGEKRSELRIRFREPVVFVRVRQHGAAVAALGATARRPGPAQAVRPRPTRYGPVPEPRLRRSESCAVVVPASVVGTDRGVEIIGDDWFDCLHVEADLPIEVAEVCWITRAEHEAAAARAADCARNEALGPHGAQVPPVLSAGSVYRVDVSTGTKLQRPVDPVVDGLLEVMEHFSAGVAPYDSGDGLVETSSFFFRTEGPPRDLGPYVKWTSPRHQSSGHFTDDDVVIRFNRPYLQRLYPDPDTTTGEGRFPYALEAVVRDAEGHVIRGFFHNWTTAASATVFPDERSFLARVAASPVPVEPSPPDDVLEVRRPLSVRRASDIGADQWTTVPLLSRGAGRPKWRRHGDGTVTVKALGNEEGSLFVTTVPAGTVRVMADDVPAGGGEIGLVVGYRSATDHVRVEVAASPRPTVRLVQLRAGARTVLQEVGLDQRRRPTLPGRPAVRTGPVRFEVAAAEVAGGWRLATRVGGVTLDPVVVDLPGHGAGVGFYARAVGASFRQLTVSVPRAELAPASRYTLVLTGGEGGPSVMLDRFEGPEPGRQWLHQPGSWTTGDGLRGGGVGATIALADSIDDVELLTELELVAGDAVRLRLRAPDERRPAANRTVYELHVERTVTDCRVTARAIGGLGRTAPAHDMGTGTAPVGAAPRVALRVRLIGDLLRAWIFDREVIDVTVGEFTVTAPAVTAPPTRRPRPGRAVPAVARTRSVLIPMAWSGRLELAVAAGSPVIRSVDRRRPALLTVDFTTSPFASLTELFDELVVEADSSVLAGDVAAATAVLAEAAVAQRALAEARIGLLASEARHAARRAERAEVEAAKQQVAAAAADLDGILQPWLLGARISPLEPPVPAIQRVLTDSGDIVAVVVTSPVPLDPWLVARPTSTPLATSGRTRFQLRQRSTGHLVPTGWVASADGSTVVLYQLSGAPAMQPTASDAALAPSHIGAAAELELSVEHVRDHGDDQRPDDLSGTGFDHLYDRPYVLSRSSREPEVIVGLVV